MVTLIEDIYSNLFIGNEYQSEIPLISSGEDCYSVVRLDHPNVLSSNGDKKKALGDLVVLVKLNSPDKTPLKKVTVPLWQHLFDERIDN